MEPFERCAQLVREAVEQGQLPGAALAVGVKDRVYVQRTFGVTSYTPEAVPVNDQTLYDMASCSKILGPTMIALRMMARGELDLCDSLTRYFGDLVPADKQDITVFHLMTHTSGYPAEIRLDRYISDPNQTAEFLLKAPLAYPTGQGVEYSCMGYILLANLLQRATGLRLDELAQREVFGPLGMTSTGYHPLDKPINPANTAYTERCIYDGEWLVGRVHDENAFFQNGVSGNAGVFTNLADFTRFVRMLACGGVLDGQRYLPRTILETACRNYTPGMDVHRGLGFHLANGYDSYSGLFFDQNAFGHTGFTGPHFLIAPDSGLFVALLTNRVHPTRANGATARLRRVLHTAAVCALEEL